MSKEKDLNPRILLLIAELRLLTFGEVMFGLLQYALFSFKTLI